MLLRERRKNSGKYKFEEIKAKSLRNIPVYSNYILCFLCVRKKKTIQRIINFYDLPTRTMSRYFFCYLSHTLIQYINLMITHTEFNKKYVVHMAYVQCSLSLSLSLDSSECVIHIRVFCVYV